MTESLIVQGAVKNHPLAVAWYAYLDSVEGRRSLKTGQTEGPYLENSLALAFTAGAQAQRDIGRGK